MLEIFKPTWMVNTIYSVSPAQLKEQGVRAVFSDLDNTLIAWNNPDGTPEMKDWLHQVQDAGIQIMVVSNNTKKRVTRAVEKFGIGFVYWALKPFAFGINRALSKLQVDRSKVVMVGDQLMTDIRAAHRAGIRSILVKPLVQHDSINTKFNRARERRVLKKLEAKYGPMKFHKGL